MELHRGRDGRREAGRLGEREGASAKCSSGLQCLLRRSANGVESNAAGGHVSCELPCRMKGDDTALNKACEEYLRLVMVSASMTT